MRVGEHDIVLRGLQLNAVVTWAHRSGTGRLGNQPLETERFVAVLTRCEKPSVAVG
jgi:hypothetical protein